MKFLYKQLKIGDCYILLQIEDEDLDIFIKNEYIYKEVSNNVRNNGNISAYLYVKKIDGYIEYVAKGGGKKWKVKIDGKSSIPYKEFILQGMIELCLSEKNFFFMHASSYFENKSLYVFLGPSGSGKTTILRLLRPKIRTSNDTIVLRLNKDNSIGIFLSPFDGKEKCVVESKKISIDNINFFSLKKTNKNTTNPLQLHEKVDLLAQNMNLYMFSCQTDIAQLKRLRNLCRIIAAKRSLTLSTSAHVGQLCFNKKITKKQFIQIQ